MHLSTNSLPLDPWSASSLLQKAIRRSHTEYAIAAAEAFQRFRGNAIWRRLTVIAFEDIGVGDLDLITDVMQVAVESSGKRSSDASFDAIAEVVRRLAEAPKNREADFAISAAVHRPAWMEARATLGCMTNAERIDIAIDPNACLVTRALAAWFASGVNGGGQKVVGRGDLVGLLRALVGTERQNSFGQAVVSAVLRTHEPIVVMVPLLWAAMQQRREYPCISATRALDAPLCRGLPSYALDKHTTLGKRAIAQFVRESSVFRAVVAEHAPEFRVVEVAGMAAFYADAVPLARTATWSQSAALETVGIEADMGKAGCSKSGVVPVISAMKANLDHLNAIRSKLFGQRRDNCQANLPLSWEA